MSAKCPRCGCEITRGDVQCPRCRVFLRWKRAARSGGEPGAAPGAEAPAEKEVGGDRGPKFCTQCGGKLEAGQRFCPGCGASAAGVRTARSAAAGRKGGASPRGPDYAEEERLWRQVKGYGWTAGGCLSGCLMAEVPLVVFLVGFVYHAVWALPVVFVIAMAVASAKRGAARARLQAHDLAGAKAAASGARNWFFAAMAADIGMGGVQVWVLFKIVKALTPLSAALGN